MGPGTILSRLSVGRDAEMLGLFNRLGDLNAGHLLNRRDDAGRLFAMGVSAVFTDRPDLWLSSEM